MPRAHTLFLVARILLVLDALMYTLIGVGVLLRPDSMEVFGILLTTATGLTTTRTWGALFAGIGIAGLTMSARRDWILPGLLLFVVVSTCIVIARVYGIWLDGTEARQWVELRREGIGFALAAAGLVMALAGSDQRK